jgi:hypothetical protein
VTIGIDIVATTPVIDASTGSDETTGINSAVLICIGDWTGVGKLMCSVDSTFDTFSLSNDAFSCGSCISFTSLKRTQTTETIFSFKGIASANLIG